MQKRPILVACFGSGTERLLLIGGMHGNEYGTAMAAKVAVYLAAHPRALPVGSGIDVIR